MTGRSTARVVTVAILVGAIGVVIARKTQRQESTPQDAIYAMLDAARTGDVAKYLASYSGEMSQALERARADSPDFAQYLRDSNAQLKGIAIMEPQAQPDRQMQLRVEYVYQDRNEAQFFYLTKAFSGWKITRVENSERVKTLLPYGTPVQ